MPERGEYLGHTTQELNPFEQERARSGSTPVPEHTPERDSTTVAERVPRQKKRIVQIDDQKEAAPAVDENTSADTVTDAHITALEDDKPVTIAERVPIKKKPQQVEDTQVFHIDSSPTIIAPEVSFSIAKKSESRPNKEPQVSREVEHPNIDTIDSALVETPENAIAVDNKDGTFVFTNNPKSGLETAHVLVSRTLDFLEKYRARGATSEKRKEKQFTTVDPVSGETIQFGPSREQRVREKQEKINQTRAKLAPSYKTAPSHAEFGDEPGQGEFVRVRESMIETDLLGAAQYARDLAVQYDHTRKLARGTNEPAQVPAFLVGQTFEDIIDRAEIYGPDMSEKMSDLLNLSEAEFQEKLLESTVFTPQKKFREWKEKIRPIEQRMIADYQKKGWVLPRGSKRKTEVMQKQKLNQPNVGWNKALAGYAESDEERQLLESYRNSEIEYGAETGLTELRLTDTYLLEQAQTLRSMIAGLQKARTAGPDALQKAFHSFQRDPRWEDIDLPIRESFLARLESEHLTPEHTDVSYRTVEPPLTERDQLGVADIMSRLKKNYGANMVGILRDPTFTNLSRPGKFALSQRIQSTFNDTQLAQEILKERKVVLTGRPGDEIGVYILKADGRAIPIHNQFETKPIAEWATIIGSDEQKTKAARSIHEYQITNHVVELESGDDLVILPRQEGEAVFGKEGRLDIPSNHTPEIDSKTLAKKTKAGHLVIGRGSVK